MVSAEARGIELRRLLLALPRTKHQAVVSLRDMRSFESFTPFAKTNFRNSEEVFGILDPDRRQHFYVVGKTGSGKSTLLRNLVLGDIQHGRGVGLIDPHGDLAEELLAYVPRERLDGRGTNDIVYFDPGDRDYPIGFNVLDCPNAEARPFVASAVVSAFKNLWADSWGPRTEYLLSHSLLALLECPGNTLLGIPRMLSDERFRARVLAHVRDPVVRAFWLKEYAAYPEHFRKEAIAPIQNKVGRLLTSAPLRNILGQPRSGFALRAVMDEGKVFVANLAKGRIGEDASNLLGSLLVALFGVSALSRAAIPEEARRDFFLHIDEFHNFTTESFASILSEARKYRLALTIVHQYIDQLPEPIRNAVFGNVGTLVSFAVGNKDAAILEREFAPVFSAADLVGLPRHHIALKLMIHGESSRPFSAKTLPPIGQDGGRAEHVRSQSRRRYARPRHIVESNIERWLGNRGTE